MSGKFHSSFRNRYSSILPISPVGQQLLLSLVPKVGEAVWAGLLVFVWQLGMKMMNSDGDLGRHLVIGSYILDSRQIPTTDLFSHTMYGQQLIPHEWLSEVIFAVVYRWLGFSGVILICGLVIATTFWLVYRYVLNASRSLFVSVFVIILVVFSSLLHWLSRPHIFTFMLLALWIFELESLRSSPGETIYRRWWIFPLSMILWVNLHGAFIAGFVTLVLYGAGLAFDHFFRHSEIMQVVGSRKSLWLSYFLVLGTSLVSSLLNPQGWRLWNNSFGYLANKLLVDITVEYRSPDFHSFYAQPFLLLIGLLVILLGARRRRIPGPQLFATGAWLLMGLYSMRNIPLFAIVSAPLLAILLGDGMEFICKKWPVFQRFWKIDRGLLAIERSTFGFLYPLLAFLFIVYPLLSEKNAISSSRFTFDSKTFPVEAVNWLDAHPQTGPVFNEFIWGGYLLYRQWPDRRVFIDGQTDFYGEELTRKYIQVKEFEDGWEQVLDQYHVTWIIIPAGDPLARELGRHSGWKSIYQDNTAEIYTINR